VTAVGRPQGGGQWRRSRTATPRWPNHDGTYSDGPPLARDLTQLIQLIGLGRTAMLLRSQFAITR
jgi:hypothetical protein